MTDSKLAVTNVIESALVDGDLAKLTPDQRVSYYMKLCESMKLNPLTRPFNYIVLNGKLTLYASKTATDQLRDIKNVSIDDVNIQEDTDKFVVIVKGHDATGRSDVEIGVVSKKDMQGNIGNVMMKAVTKGKRRLTLSICGLGMLDETEIETIPQAKAVTVIETGEIVNPVQEQLDTIRKVEANKPVISEATNSAGDTKLVDLPIDKLSHMANSLIKSLRDPNLEVAIRKSKQVELDAIQEIIADKNHPVS